MGVAPFTGAWIEICRGHEPVADDRVAPFTGAWIEIGRWMLSGDVNAGRSLHGSVD